MNIITKIKAQVSEKSFQVIGKIKSSSKELALSQFANEIKVVQRKRTARGNPVTEYELIQDLTSDWVGVTKKTWESMGVTLDELIETGKQAISDTSGELLPEPTGITKKIIDLTQKIGRNHQCPCGSGIKYKKCCGRDG